MTYKGKKLLILGGISHMIDIVLTSKKLGIYTVVIDYDPKSPAKLIADKSYDVSTTDIDSILEIAKVEKIDGVINAFEDLNIWVAQEVCEKMKLPFYATRKQIDIITNKDKFKKFSRENKVPVIEEYFIGDNLSENVINDIEYPVIIKPVDSYGSKGISICNSREELELGFKYALEYSKNRKVIIEKYINSEYGVEMYYTIQSGKVYLSAVTDRYVYKQLDNTPPLPVATIYPSQHSNYYCNTLDSSVREMIKNMDIKNGVVLIQALFENDKFYIYEMAYRLTGEQHYQIIEKQTNINLLEMMIGLALGMDIKKYDISKYDNGYIRYPSCNLSFLLKEGTIKEIKGIDELYKIPQVVSYIQTLYVGDKVKLTGNYAQMFLRINICAMTKDKLSETIKYINRKISVLDEYEQEMIITYFDMDN